MPDQLVLIQNFQSKIAGYATVLGLSPAQLTAAQAICDAFVGTFNVTEQCRQTMLAMTQWRDQVFNGSPMGNPAPAAPVFPVVGTVDYQRGIIRQFTELRDLIVALPGYNVTIGEDLGLVGAVITPPAPVNVKPVFKDVRTVGYTVSLTGSMQGMDALRVEYAPNGGSFAPVAFLTNTPGSFQITPANPNQPEAGRIRAVFIRKNAEYGNFSADYPVTVS